MYHFVLNYSGEIKLYTKVKNKNKLKIEQF